MTRGPSICMKCDQEVVPRGWFWALPSEQDSKMVAFCPAGGAHEVETQDELEAYATPLTKEQAAVIGAYTGVLCGSFSDLHAYIERIMGRPVFTHEMADRGMADRIKAAATADFMVIVVKS